MSLKTEVPVCKQKGTADDLWRRAKAPFELWFVMNYQVSEPNRIFEADANGIFVKAAVQEAYKKWHTLRAARAFRCSFLRQSRNPTVV
ncbi:hypothetical protein ALP27_03956 [Pseudomonas savastanoi pv. glycinea]|uniref:hypothetical protein n=1 Tax=Pseudomonas savastanoi TaxID=29438 RepID=UPI000F3DC2ED|nr:hypothetical protein [Pseudomonas savastanoi]RMU56215.1 hypothetical protein ALP27_03956 [Pseudomonas savastanoi pv. glycinea]